MFAEMHILNAISEFQVLPSSLNMENGCFRMYKKNGIREQFEHDTVLDWAGLLFEFWVVLFV